MITLMMVWHSKHLYYNLTTYERRHDVHMYDLGWKENLKQVFGARWYIAWLFPWIDSPLPGDGIDFPTRFSYESQKDM